LGFGLDDDFPKRLDLVEIDFIQVRFSHIETDLGFGAWHLFMVASPNSLQFRCGVRWWVSDETAGCAWWNSLPDAVQHL
jgi:hypothetical protein